MTTRQRVTRLQAAVAICPIVIGATALLVVGSASAAPAPVPLGTAGSFAVLGGSTVTNTGPSVVGGDLGVSPGTAVTGFPPGTVSSGSIHAADAVAAQAQADTTTAYNDAAGRTATTTISADLGGQTLVAGVYGGGALGLTGTLTLDAQGDPNAVFIFQAASTLITATGSRVALINGATPCNVFWKIGSSATVEVNSSFAGTILALTSITAKTGASVVGRLLARNGAVTLDTNTITVPSCAAGTTTTTAGPTTTTAGPTTTTAGPTTTTGPTTTVVATTPTNAPTTPTLSGPTSSGPTSSGPTSPTAGPTTGGTGAVAPLGLTPTRTGGLPLTTGATGTPSRVVTPIPARPGTTALAFTGAEATRDVAAALALLLVGALAMAGARTPSGAHFATRRR